MDRHHRSRSFVISTLLLILVWGGPALYAQCPIVTNTMSTAIGSFVQITKTLSGTANCVTTMSNAFGCGRAPTATMATQLIATALTMATAVPYCNWDCTCSAAAPDYTTDGSDGLPVELMDFSVE